MGAAIRHNRLLAARLSFPASDTLLRVVSDTERGSAALRPILTPATFAYARGGSAFGGDRLPPRQRSLAGTHHDDGFVQQNLAKNVVLPHA